MKTYLILCSLLLAQVGFAKFDPIKMKAKVDENIALNFAQNSQVGISLGIISGNEIYQWNYGTTDLEKNLPISSNSILEIGSITKTFTATLLAEEVIKKKVSLTDKIEKFIPELLNHDAGKITLEQLATHRSGLPRLPDNLKPINPLNPYKEYSPKDMLNFLLSYKNDGTKITYLYSNLGIGLLGYILSEKLNNVPFEIYLKQNILNPLKMKQTKLNLSRSDYPNIAQPYDSFFHKIPFWDFDAMAPAGAIKSTINDMILYLNENMNPSSDLLGLAINLSHRPRAETDTKGAKIGLVWESVKLGNYDVIAHSGGTGGFRANLVFDKKQKLGAIILSNTDTSPQCILAAVFEMDCTVTTFSPFNSKTFEKFHGTYENNSLKVEAKVFIENSFPTIQITDQSMIRLWPVTERNIKYPV